MSELTGRCVETWRIVIDAAGWHLGLARPSSMRFLKQVAAIDSKAGGSADEKTKAAFALYDVNGDGFITQEEMTGYLTNVFNVMYSLDAATRERFSKITARELAIATTNEAFETSESLLGRAAQELGDSRCNPMGSRKVK